MIHGVIELLATLAIFTGQAPPFIFPEIRENWQQAVLIGFISGVVRVIAAFGVFRGMKWGLALGILFSATTLASLTFYLPYGVMDALLSGIVLILLVVSYYGKEKIEM
ncbi:MAG: hypothetical protein AOA65_0312 [Candidatus Bathyarchaeota archaeon BA1]|nr:MAG: hypothetical protein AOA65_0312 [Candidatus Bathyarchaeota archaeon BA1]